MKPEAYAPAYDWKGKKILIVEDDYSSFLFFHELLSTTNVCIIRAVSLQEAFDLITSSLQFDILIVNTSLPGNENCRSVKRIKLLWPELRVIAIAGSECKGRNRNCFPSGCDTLINYQKDGTEMLAAVDELIAI